MIAPKNLRLLGLTPFTLCMLQNCNVPQQSGCGELGTWVNTQRTVFKEGTIRDDRIAKLEEVGFTWNALDTLWEERFEELKDYKATHGVRSILMRTL